MSPSSPLGSTSQSPADCKLGREPRRRRGGACSACKPPQEFEVDRAVAQLIDSATFTRAAACPYRVVADHLVAGLTLGPEVARARSGQSLIDPAVEIKRALKLIHSVLYASGLNRDDIETISMSNGSARWQALYAIVEAERDLTKALELLKSSIPVRPSRAPRGRTGRLRNQAIAGALASAWCQLTGRLPNKGNSKFHGLLLATITSFFGAPVKEPNLESATKIAVDRIRRMRAGVN